MRLHPLILGIAGLASSASAQARPPLKLAVQYVLDDAAGVSFGQISRIDLTPDGGVVAVDGANGVIYRFTAAGKLRDSLGRKGQGPGEFQIPAGLGVGPAGEVAIADLKVRRLTIWEADGTLRGSTQFTGMPADLLWRGSEPVIGLVSFGPVVMIRWGAARLGESKIAGELGEFPDPMIAEYATAVSCGVCRHTLTSAGRLLVAAPDTFYRVTELDGAGKALRVWQRKDVGAGLRTQEELTALRNRLAAGPGGGKPPLPGGRPLPPLESRFRPPDADALRFRPRFQGIGMDQQGRLLALVSNAGSPNPVIDVFGADGKYLGSVTPDRALQGLVVRGNRVAALGETADGVPLIVVYRIESP